MVFAPSHLDSSFLGFRPNHSFLRPMHSQGPGILVLKIRVNADGNPRKLRDSWAHQCSAQGKATEVTSETKAQAGGW